MIADVSLSARRNSPSWGSLAFTLHSHHCHVWRHPAAKGLRMHKGESCSWIYLGNPRSSWMWNTVTTAAILVLASPPSPDMLLSMYASWVSLQGEAFADLVTNRPQSLACLLNQVVYIFHASCFFFMLEFLFPCTLLYSCVLIKIANYLRIFLWEEKTSLSLEFFLVFYFLFFIFFLW